MTATLPHTVRAPEPELPALSLIVPTLDRFDVVDRLLQSLSTQTGSSFEIILVDQNADDRLVPLVAEWRTAGLQIKHVRFGERGATNARNQGVLHARAALIGFPDDDCWYEPSVVAHVLGFFEGAPNVQAMVAHWVEHDSAGERASGALQEEAWRRFKGGQVACFALFFRRDTLLAAGGFSEEFGPGRYYGCGEEEDLIFRLFALNAQIVYCSNVHIHHPHAPEQPFTAAECARNRKYGRGTGAVLAKHRLPAWVVARGLVGPFVNALRGPRRADRLRLGAYTVWGRVEGLTGWWLSRGHRGGRGSGRP